MATYKFPTFNSEIVDPEITVSADGISIFPSNMTIDVDILLTTPNGSKQGVRLNDVKVQNLSYDDKTLITRVMARLEDFIV